MPLVRQRAENENKVSVFPALLQPSTACMSSGTASATCSRAAGEGLTIRASF